MEIKKDSKFEKLMPELTEAELAELTDSIRNEGCRTPLVVWKEEGILLDGHQRLRICRTEGKPFDVDYKSFASEDDAVDWVIRQHVGRRNLSKIQRACFLGRLYNRLKKPNGGDRRSAAAKNEALGKNTATTLAEKYGISASKIKRDAALAQTVDSLTKTHGDEVRNLLLSPPKDGLKPTEQDIRGIGKAKDDQAEILKRLKAVADGRMAPPKSVRALIKDAKREGYRKRNSPQLNDDQILDFEQSMRLLHGDAAGELKRLRLDSIDCVVVDPPWGVGNRRAWGGDALIANDDEAKANALLQEACAELRRTCKADAHLYFIVGTQNVDHFRAAIGRHFDIVNVLIWHKGSPSLVDFDMKYAPVHEFIIFAKQKGEKQRPLNGNQLSDVLFAQRLRDASDTCEKPVELLEQLIANSTQEGQVVLDFCMGTGSCGEAAMRLGRRFVGIEIDDKRYKDASHRLKELWAKKSAVEHACPTEAIETVHRIEFGDAREKLQQVAEESVDLVLTSPPYYNAEGYFDDCFKDYEEFQDLLRTLAVESNRVLKDGRIAVVNVSDVLVGNGKKEGPKTKYPIVADVTKAFHDVGLNYREKIVWRKPSNVAARSRRSGNFIQYGQFPIYYYAENVMETILVFQKGRYRYDSVSDEIKAMSKIDLERYLFEGWNLDVWDIAPICGNGIDSGCAAFPLELAHRLISLYSHVGETILDPFMGTGTTAKACAQLGRNSIGFEIDRGRAPIIVPKFEGVEHCGILELEGLEGPLPDAA